MWVQPLALLSGFRIWLCCELWCRSQMQLGSCVAVAVVEASIWISSSTPSLETSTCLRGSPKNKQCPPAPIGLTGLKSEWQPSWFFFEAPGEHPFLPLATSQGHLSMLLDSGSFRNQQRSIFEPLFCLCLHRHFAFSAFDRHSSLPVAPQIVPSNVPHLKNPICKDCLCHIRKHIHRFWERYYIDLPSVQKYLRSLGLWPLTFEYLAWVGAVISSQWGGQGWQRPCPGGVTV